MSRHTPGPWNIEDGDIIAEIGPHVASITSADDLPCIEDSKYGEVSDECAANASLIAAAPEMIDFIETLENDDGEIPEWLWKRRNELIRKARDGA